MPHELRVVNDFGEVLLEYPVPENCTQFERAALQDVELSGACLQGTSFREADLYWACFAGTRLEHADLTGANLQGADLSTARLDGARLTRAAFDCDTRFPPGFDPLAHGMLPVDRTSSSACTGHAPG